MGYSQKHLITNIILKMGVKPKWELDLNLNADNKIWCFIFCNLVPCVPPVSFVNIKHSLRQRVVQICNKLDVNHDTIPPEVKPIDPPPKLDGWSSLYSVCKVIPEVFNDADIRTVWQLWVYIHIFVCEPLLHKLRCVFWIIVMLEVEMVVVEAKIMEAS